MIATDHKHRKCQKKGASSLADLTSWATLNINNNTLYLTYLTNANITTNVNNYNESIDTVHNKQTI